MRTRTKLLIGGFATGALLTGAAGGLAAVLTGRSLLSQLRRRGMPLPWRPRSLGDLRGKTVLITGSSRGLGLALAEEFALQGCKLVLCARNEHELARARQLVERLGAEVCAAPGDISQPQQVEHVLKVARQHFGEIDILVNNAGIISVGPLLAQTLEDFHEAMDAIFWGTVHPTLAVLPEMIERGQGKIVNVTSIGGRVSMPHLLPYNCAKFATVGFSEGLHAELKRFGIHVLTVLPGLMRTGSHLNACFKGNHAAEYRWFSLAGTNPLLTISAGRAARRIVAATRANRAELVLGWQAKTLANLHAISPALTVEALALVNRLLPEATLRPATAKRGREIEPRSNRSPLLALGRRAARRYNQIDEAA